MASFSFAISIVSFCLDGLNISENRIFKLPTFKECFRSVSCFYQGKKKSCPEFLKARQTWFSRKVIMMIIKTLVLIKSNKSQSGNVQMKQ